MIYDSPIPNDAIDQGDLIDDCPVASVADFSVDKLESAKIQLDFHRVVVLTQTCDLANKKTDFATVASVFDAQQLVDRQILSAADIKGPMRAGRVWGFYFLPTSANPQLSEMIIDLRRLHTISLKLLNSLCVAGKRRARLQSPYREHLAKHFADTYSRIGLPRPYETL